MGNHRRRRTKTIIRPNPPIYRCGFDGGGGMAKIGHIIMYIFIFVFHSRPNDISREKYSHFLDLKWGRMENTHYLSLSAENRSMDAEGHLTFEQLCFSVLSRISYILYRLRSNPPPFVQRDHGHIYKLEFNVLFIFSLLDGAQSTIVVHYYRWFLGTRNIHNLRRFQ
jgi:hypothetical protein